MRISEQLDSDDDSDEHVEMGHKPAIKKERNSTFSQIEEVIELYSDGEDAAIQSWCSSQINSSHVKLEKSDEYRNDDSLSSPSPVSPCSFESPSRSSIQDEESEGKLN